MSTIVLTNSADREILLDRKLKTYPQTPNEDPTARAAKII